MDDVAFSAKLEPAAFKFDLELDASAPLTTFDDSARLHGRFRHFHTTAIELTPGISGAYNIGVKLFPAASKTQLFEDRMTADSSPIEPGTWTGVSVRIPRSAINFRDSFTLTADVLKEDEFWFASLGAPAREAELTFTDGLQPLHEPPAAPIPAPLPVSTFATNEAAETQAATTHLVFDVSDLIQYFQHARLPTGIQRVQIEVITNLVFSLPEDCSLKIACFTKLTDTWAELPTLFFSHLCKLAQISGDRQAPDWLRALEELRAIMGQSRRLAFHRGAYLINLGTSWWLQNYFLHVRAAKARYGIRYVPYVHDCIPIMAPEHCVENLTRDFITWALGAFQHADHIIVNSKATAADVKLVAARLGHKIEDPSVVTLDADYRAANAKLPAEALDSEIFLKNEIRPGEYVLFVSTVESRKNHLLAFSAWLSLTKKHGIRAVPKLVCVGNRGWLNDAIYSKLAASKILQQKVVMLSGISDPDLELLYRNCLFTLYPSAYEGWGLPVTESLCFGKVPVLSTSSSLPEAGGDFAEYFDPGSETALLQTLERMMFDQAYRQSREQHIVKSFRPRSWSAIAQAIVTLAQTWSKTDQPADHGPEAFAASGIWPFPVEPGRYYGLTENQHFQILPGMEAGELFRQGDAWWWPEPWGCWTKAKTARLAFLAPLKPKSSAVLYLGISGVQGQHCTAAISLEGVSRRTVNLAPEQSQWLVFRISKDQLRTMPKSADGILFDLLISANKSADFRATTEGRDHRIAGIGVYGFMVCTADDMEARMTFIESVALNDLAGLSLTAEGDAARAV